MRRPIGHGLYPGNAAAARRCARARKPPPIILWSIGIFTCLLFMGSAAMLAVGYLNPFGTVGLSILGVGAVVYFGAIIFLVLSCLWVERKYPGMQPLSFKFYSKKPQRPTPTTFVNPNTSGQIPQNPQTTSPYRIHNEIPSNVTSVSNIEEVSDHIPSKPRVPTQNKDDKQNENDVPEQVSFSSHDNPPTTQESLQDDGSEDIIKDHVPEAMTEAKTRNQEGDTSAITSENKSNPQINSATTNTTNVQNENVSQTNQKDSNLEKPSSAQKETIMQQKNHHLELPIEDYPNNEKSTPAASNIKAETQRSQPQDTTQQRRKSVENIPSDITVAPSISTLQKERTTMHQQKETSKDDVSGLSSAKEQQSLFVQKNTSQTVNAEKDKIFKKDQNANDIPQTEKLQRQSAVRVRKQKNEPQSQHIQNIAQETIIDLTSTDSALNADGRKLILHNEHDTLVHPPKANKNIDSAVLTRTSAVSGTSGRRVQFQEHHHQSVQPSTKPVNDHSKVSSVTDANNVLQYKIDWSHGHQNVAASTKHSAQNPGFHVVSPELVNKLETAKNTKKGQSPERRKKNDDSDKPRNPESPGRARKSESPERIRKPESPESPRRSRKPELPGSTRTPESPERARKAESPRRPRKMESPEMSRKPESPERGRKLKIDHNLPQSPPNVRKIGPSSPPTRHRQNVSPKAQRKLDYAIAMTNLSTSKEELFRRQHNYSSPSSQSSDISSSISSSPPRQGRRSPDFSPKQTKHQFHTSGNTDVYLNAMKEKRRDRQQQSSPSSYSSDVPSSTSSSPPRHRLKDSDISNKAQRQKEELKAHSAVSSNAKKDDLNKRLGQQLSQSNDIILSTAMSPTKRLQYKTEQADLNNSTSRSSRDRLVPISGTTAEYKHQTNPEHHDKPRTSSQSRELSPTAAKTSPRSNKRFPANPRDDQT